MTRLTTHLLSLACLAATSPLAAQAIQINEFSYDDADPEDSFLPT